MGYSSSIRGTLEFAVRNTEPVQVWPAEMLELAKKNNLDLPVLEKPRTGLSAQAVKRLNDLEVAYFLRFDEDGADADDSEAGKAYSFEVDLKEVLDIVTADGCTITGTLVKVGEEQGDVERFVFADGTFKTEEAELRWPDGSKVTEAYL